MSASLPERFNRWLVSLLPTFLLAGGQVLLLALSVRQAEWVVDSTPILAMLFLGFLMGWMLAATRWRGWVVLVYSLPIGLFLVVQSLVRIVLLDGKSLSSPFLSQVTGMHLRLVAFELRVGGWIGVVASGGTVRDTGLFEMLLALAAWVACVWLMWWLARRRQALPGLLPLFGLMAVNVHLSRQPRMTLLSFAALAVLSMLYSAFRGQQRDWVRRRVDYSEELGVEWGLIGGLVSAVVLGFALLFSLVGTPDGWQVFADLVEKSRQQMSDTSTQLFGGVKPPPPPEEEALKPPAVVNTPELGEIGVPISEGEQTILYAWVSDPPPPPDNLGGPPRESTTPRHYWRSGVFGAYTGRGWQPVGLAAGAAKSQEEPVETDGRYLLKQRYEIPARHPEMLFAVNDPVSSNNGTTLRKTLADGSQLVEGRTTTYEVTSRATSVTVNALEEASAVYPLDIRAEYMQLPDALPARVKRLASEISTGAFSPYQKADKIQKYLRGTYAYQLAVAPPPLGRDVVDYFLFDAPGGFCSYFASAMVVLLRIEGVPARVASGYAMGVYDAQRGMYRVPASAAHAWVEVYFPGLGWVEFEPTPAYSEIAYPLGLASAGGPQLLPVQKVEVPKPQKPNQLLWLLVPLGLVVLLWGFYFWFQAEKKRLAEPGRLAVKLYRRVQGGLARAGLRAGPQLTAFEFVDEAAPILEDYPRLLDVLERATDLYVESVYSGREPRVDDVTEGEWLWGQARSELLAFWLRAHFKRR
jgi:transglutaminase-like putative cysteine protease